MSGKIKSQSLKMNFVFQTLYQVIILVIPLVVSPYLTRALGDTSLGIYTYTYSIAYYFVLFAMLGISKHGQRVIATRKNDETALRKTFWSLYFVHSLFSVLAIALYIGFVFLFGGEYKTVYLIQIVYVVSALFDVTWLFYGLENFKSVVIRNLIIKVAECVCIFVFVKSSADLVIYTIIMSVSICAGQLVMIPQALVWVKPIKFSRQDIKEHVKPLFVLFIAVVATSLYTVFDKTLLGYMTNKENVAFYEYSNKIITVPQTVISVVATVLFPRACACLANGEVEKSQRYMNFSLHFTNIVGIGSIFGLLGVSKLFAVLYYGNEFAICGNLIMALSPVIYIVGLGAILRIQYMIPNHMDTQYILSMVLSAVTNIAVSVALIPVLGIYGTVLGTIFAELVGLVFQLIVCRKFLSIKKVVLTLIPYLVCSAVMFGAIYLVRTFLNSTWWDLILQIAVGIVVYFALCAVYLLTLSPIKNDLKNALRRKKNRAASIEEPSEGAEEDKQPEADIGSEKEETDENDGAEI